MEPKAYHVLVAEEYEYVYIDPTGTMSEGDVMEAVRTGVYTGVNKAGNTTARVDIIGTVWTNGGVVSLQEILGKTQLVRELR